MFNFFEMAGNYEQRKVGLTEVDGLNVSTAWTTDEGYETAIIDIDEQVYPVERYESKEDAEAGHAKWCESAKTITNITKLGLTDSKEVQLKRIIN